MEPESPYKTIQGLTRGIAVLRALNRAEDGWASIRELSTLTGIHRTTVRRLLETLQKEKLVRRSPSDDSYRLTADVRTLSDGFRDDEWISSIAPPIMGELLLKVVWPSDLATLDGLDMLVRETTHRFSPLSFHGSAVRRRMPLVSTALGRAYLAFCPEDERDHLLDQLTVQRKWPASGPNRSVLMSLLAQHRAEGHAYNNGDMQTESRILALAVPVFHDNRVAGCVNLIMLRSAINLADARARYLEPLQAAARKMESYLANPEQNARA